MGSGCVASHIFQLLYLMEVGGQVHTPFCLTSKEKSSDAHWTGVWIDPMSNLCMVGGEKSQPCWGMDPDS